MSDSIQNQTAIDSLDGEGGGRKKWIALSILAHLLVLAWIFSLKAPVAQSLADAAKGSGQDAPQPTPLQDKLAASPERVEEVAKEINAIQADEVKDKVQELLATEDQLAEINKEKLRDFSALAKELSKDAPQKTADALAAVTQAQDAARKAQEEAVAALTGFEQAKKDMAGATPGNEAGAKQQVDSKEHDARVAQEKAKNAQSAATQAQTKAAQQLAFEGEGFAAAKKAQENANAAQEAANNKQDDASSKVNEVGWSEQTARSKQDAVASAQRDVAAAASQLESRQKDLETAKIQAQQLADALEKTKAAAADAKGKLQQAAENAKMAAINTSNIAEQQVVKAHAEIVKQQERTGQIAGSIKEAQKKLDEEKGKAAGAAEELAKAGTTAEQSSHKAVTGQQEALAAQQKAGELQALAMSEITKAGRAANPVSPDAQSTATPPDATAAAEDLDGKNFAELYGMAADSEKKIAAQYKDIRAEESAKLRQIPISEAAKSIEVPLPVRPPLDPSIASSNIQSAEALNIHNEAMEKALQQIDSMVTVARDIAYQAQGRDQQGMNISVEDMKVEAQQADKLTELASEHQGDVYADLSQLMEHIEDGNGHHEEGGGGVDLGGQGAPGANPTNGAPGSAPGAASAAPPGANGHGNANVNSDRGAGFGGRPVVRNVKDSIPGRKVHGKGDGAGAQWMFVDTWYVIGPFPNPARRNIDTKFPPDSVIDLDASYVGKDDKLVRWHFQQSSKVEIHPLDQQEYAIYYAYTTLWFDEPRDMWIAVGSDDFSKIWINDLLVWSSGTEQKPWSADEGFRKVHFKKGLNRILDRVENGWGGCSYSLMLDINGK